MWDYQSKYVMQEIEGMGEKNEYLPVLQQHFVELILDVVW